MSGGTKGSHLVVERFAGAPVGDALYAEARADARPFFIIPWNNLLLIGTTDTRYEGDLDRVVADEREMAYLLNEANHLLPQARLGREQILYTYAGIRPLPFAGERAESRITRRHFVHDHGPPIDGLISIVGGKLTTYRSLSEETVDLLFKKLGRAAPPSTTARTPLPGAHPAGADLAQLGEQLRAESGLPEAAVGRLLKIYGGRAPDVWRLASEEAELRAPLGASGDEACSMLAAEVLFSFRVEMAETLDDCLLRRTMAGLGREAGLDVVDAAAGVAKKFLGWDDARVVGEVAAYRQHVARFHPRSYRERTTSVLKQEK